MTDAGDGTGMDVLIFLTAYNEVDALGPLLEELTAFVATFEHESPHSVDILVVDDCSSDGTRNIIESHDVQSLYHPRNLGPGAATRTGYKFAVRRGYEVTVRMDADGQHRPSDIPQLLEPVLAGEADIAIGSRFLSTEGYDPSALRNVGIRYYSKLISLITGKRVSDITSGFRAVTAAVAREHAKNMPNGIVAIDRGLREGIGEYRIVERPVRMEEREHGESYLTLARLAKYPIYSLYSLIVALFRFNP